MTTTQLRSPVSVALALTAGIAVLASLITLAPSQAAPAGWRARSLPAPVSIASTRIEVDGQGHVIRFFIDGQQLAMLDSVGLHIEDGVLAQ